MKKIVVIDAWIHSTYMGRDFSPLQKVCDREGYELIIEDLREKDEIIEAVKDADAIVTCYTKIDKEILSKCNNLKVVIRAAIGPDVFNLDDFNELGIPACNVPTYCTEEVASHTMALLLATARKLRVSDSLVRQGVWNINCIAPAHRLSTQTLGFIGFGRIARKTLEMAKGFNFNVLAYDPFVSEEEMKKLGVTKASLDDLCKDSDLISVNAPLSDKTYHLVDKALVDKMKDGVFIVNTGRGAVISTDALIYGLESGKIAGAGLDVLEEEPLTDPDAEILKYDNVIVTAHTAYYSIEARRELYEITGETIVSVLNGELPENVLNREGLLEKK